MISDQKYRTVGTRAPDNALCVLSKARGDAIYLTGIRLPCDYELELLKPTQHGDYYLFFHSVAKSVGSTIEKHNVHCLHIIPEDQSRLKLEIRMESSLFYENGEYAGDCLPSTRWMSEGYFDDHNDREAARVLRYFNKHYKKFPKSRDCLLAIHSQQTIANRAAEYLPLRQALGYA